MTFGDNNTLTYWVSHKLYQYTHHSLPVSLIISLENSITEKKDWKSINYNQVKLVFSICDKNVSTNSVKIDLTYPELYYLLKTSQVILKDINTAYQNGSNISISRNYVKFVKRMTISFTKGTQETNTSGSHLVSININDTSSDNLNIVLNVNDWLIIHDLLLNIKQNFSSYSNLIISICNDQRIFEKQCEIINNVNMSVNSLNNMIDSKFERVQSLVRSQNNNYDNVLDKVELNQNEFDISDESPLSDNNINEVDDLQNNFDKINDLSNPDLLEYIEKDSENSDSILPEHPNTVFSNNVYIKSFLKNNFNNLATLQSSITLLDNKSSIEMFDVIKVLLSNSIIYDKNIFDNDVNYYFYQYGLIHSLKNGIKEYLINGKFKQYPPLKFGFNIDKYSSIFEFSKNSLITFLILRDFVSKLNKFSQVNDESLLLIYKQITYFVQVALLPFVVSSDLMNLDFNDLYTLLSPVFNDFIQSGIIERLDQEYKIIIGDGTYKFDFTTFEKNLQLFWENRLNLKYIDCSKKNIDTKVFDKPNLNNKIDSLEKVKEYVIKYIHFNIQDDCVDDVSNQEKETHSKIEETDKKLELFIRCVDDDKLKKEIKEKCKIYSDIVNVINFSECDDNIAKIKRVIDQHKEVSLKSEVLSLVNNLTEDINVTKARVESETINENDVVYDKELEKILFGQVN